MLAAADPLLSRHGAQQHERGPSVNAVWVVVAVGIVGALAKWVFGPYERWQSDLGFVSQQWLAEHRISQISDPQR
jgi:hypothetical protein